ADPEEREQIYKDVNRRLGEQVYNYWLNWTIWAVASDPNVYGAFGPNLPSRAGPFPGLAGGHPGTGVCVQQCRTRATAAGHAGRGPGSPGPRPSLHPTTPSDDTCQWRCCVTC